jgi:hypothetical protein
MRNVDTRLAPSFIQNISPTKNSALRYCNFVCQRRTISLDCMVNVLTKILRSNDLFQMLEISP